jgi:hypothetical protein
MLYIDKSCMIRRISRTLRMAQRLLFGRHIISGRIWASRQNDFDSWVIFVGAATCMGTRSFGKLCIIVFIGMAQVEACVTFDVRHACMLRRFALKANLCFVEYTASSSLNILILTSRVLPHPLMVFNPKQA